jgi:hypothetical protein
MFPCSVSLRRSVRLGAVLLCGVDEMKVDLPARAPLRGDRRGAPARHRRSARCCSFHLRAAALQSLSAADLRMTAAAPLITTAPTQIITNQLLAWDW